VFRQKRAWVETQATWNIYSTGNNWSTAGGFHVDDCEQTDIGNRAFTATETLNQFKDFTLTAASIAEMIAGGGFTNNGFLIKADTETNDQYLFAGSGDGTAENRPKLVIDYTSAFSPRTQFMLSLAGLAIPVGMGQILVPTLAQARALLG
jgi:hypothetical protein